MNAHMNFEKKLKKMKGLFGTTGFLYGVHTYTNKIYYNAELHLLVGQFLIVLEQTVRPSGLLEKQLELYKEWANAGECVDLYMQDCLIDSPTYIVETTKLRMLNKAIIHKLTSLGEISAEQTDAERRDVIIAHLTNVYLDILQGTSLKPVIKYIFKSNDLSESRFIQFQKYIEKTNIHYLLFEHMEYNKFIYDLVYAFVGQIISEERVNQSYQLVEAAWERVNNCLTLSEELKQIENGVRADLSYDDYMKDVHAKIAYQNLSDIYEFQEFLETIHNELNEYLGNHQRLDCSVSAVSDELTKHAIFIVESLRCEKHIASALENGLIEEFLIEKKAELVSHTNRLNQWLKRLGFVNGTISAAVLLEKLQVYLNAETKSFFDYSHGLMYFKQPYAIGPSILQHFNIDCSFVLNHTKLTIEDLKSFTHLTLKQSPLIKATYFSSYWFTSPFFGKERSIQLTPNEEVIHFITDRNMLISMLLQFIFAKHIKETAKTNARQVRLALPQNTQTTNNAIAEKDRLLEENEKLANEIITLKQQLQQVNLSLHHKTIAHENEIKLMKAQMQEQMQQLELNDELNRADLKEEGISIVELPSDEISQEDIAEDYVKLIHYLKVAVIGGHNNFHANIRNEFTNKNLVLIAPRNYTTPIKVINTADVIIYIDSHNNHGQFRRVMSQIKKADIKQKMLYLSSQPQPKMLAKVIYEHYMKQQI